MSELQFVPIREAGYAMPRNDQRLTDELQRELDAIFNNSFDGLWIFDGNGVSLRCNPAYERISGFPAQQLSGKHVSQLLAEGLLSRSVVPDVIETRRRQTIVNMNRNGKRLLATGTPVFDAVGNIWRIVCNVRDISELDELNNALERTSQLVRHYEAELQRYREQQLEDTGGLVLRDPNMQRVIDMAMRAGGTDSTVLLLGESGVGKEVIADLIHQRSLRRDAPLIKVNCGAVPETLMEAEFFGYERGAFTGARETGKPGYFEMADKGTLVLDEVAELPLHMQAKLLRVLQDLQVLRVGGSQPRRFDVRVVAATNQDLMDLVRQGRFREDLYYRLNVVPIVIPPLRQRREDVPALATHFLDMISRRHGRSRTISPAAMDVLQAYPWPGNVRELRNIVERLVILTPHQEIGVADLPPAIRDAGGRRVAGGTGSLKNILAACESDVIREALVQHGGVRAAARALGIPHSTLLRRMDKLKITPVQG